MEESVGIMKREGTMSFLSGALQGMIHAGVGAAKGRYDSSLHLSSFEMTAEDQCAKFIHNGRYYDRNAFILENSARFAKFFPDYIEEMKAKALANKEQGIDVELSQAVIETCDVALGNVEPSNYAPGKTGPVSPASATAPKIRYCCNCGKEMSPTAKFCAFCGTKNI